MLYLGTKPQHSHMLKRNLNVIAEHLWLAHLLYIYRVGEWFPVGGYPSQSPDT